MEANGSRRDGGRAGTAGARSPLGPAAAGLALGWAGGGWLLAGAAREAALPWAPWAFHAVAVLAAIELLVASRREGRARSPLATDRLVAGFRELGAGDLMRATEIGRTLPVEIGAAVERAAGGIGGRVERLQASSLSVAGAAEGVERGSASLAAGATQQAAAAGEVTAAMEELARTAAEIAEHAERQSALVARAEAEGAAGAAAVGDAVAGVGAVERRIADVTARADTLGNRSREIFRVLELISEIAQETHLLSLNAALEAAAAGERGRRFAVVAGEVRQLAGRVRESVAAVRSQVEEFASAIRSTVVATEEGGKEVARVLDEARAATAALDGLRAALAESSLAARQISSVTRQQTAATDEVVSTLRELNQVVERMSRDLGKLSATARRLHEVGLDLQLAAQTFRLDSPRSLKRLVDRWAERLSGTDGAGATPALEELVRAARFVEAGYLADADGRLAAIAIAEGLAGQAAAAIEQLKAVDLRARDWFRDAVESERSVVTPPQRSLLSGDPCLTVALPRRTSDGRLAGVLGIDINVRHWTEIGG